MDKVLVNEATSCSTVEQSFDGVGLSNVCCEEFYRQYKRCSASVLDIHGKSLG